jgi:carbon storage regulator
VIRRRPGESLVIGEHVEIEILETAGSSVKLGIRAPKSVAVIRKELQLTQAQNRAAARTASDKVLHDLLHSLKPGLPAPISPP